MRSRALTVTSLVALACRSTPNLLVKRVSFLGLYASTAPRGASVGNPATKGFAGFKKAFAPAYVFVAFIVLPNAMNPLSAAPAEIPDPGGKNALSAVGFANAAV